MRHADPVRAPGRRTVGARGQHLLSQLGGRPHRRHRAIRVRLPGQAREPGDPGDPGDPGGTTGTTRSTEPAQAFVPRDRVQPRPKPVRVAEPLESGCGDDKGVLHRVGGVTQRSRAGQHKPAVGIERPGVTVIRFGEPTRVTCGDGRDQLAVVHAPNRSSPLRTAESERHNRYQRKGAKSSYGHRISGGPRH